MGREKQGGCSQVKHHPSHTAQPLAGEGCGLPNFMAGKERPAPRRAEA